MRHLWDIYHLCLNSAPYYMPAVKLVTIFVSSTPRYFCLHPLRAGSDFIQYRSGSATEWTPYPTAVTIRGMARYTFPAFNRASAPRYVVLWDMHWHVIDCQRLEPAADLSGAMAGTIDRLAGDGWQAEATPEYGFVFVRRETERRLLMLTPRDPYDTTRQSFSPFQSPE